MQNKETARESTYGSFYLGSAEFAITAKHIQEVVVPPEAYNEIPLAPPHLRGLFNLRGAIIPVIDLRVLLQLNAGVSDASDQRIVVVECGAATYGILVNRVSEILKKVSYEAFEFNKREGGVQFEYVEGALKLDQGKRLVYCLDAVSLLKVPGLAQQLNDDSSRTKGTTKSRGPRRQCISFEVGDTKCALGIETVQEIIKIEQVHSSVLAFGSCIGSVDLRGVTVPIVDFASLLKQRESDRSASATTGDKRIFILKIDQDLFGLLVDRVDSIVSYYADEVASFAAVAEDERQVFSGTLARAGEREIALLDTTQILSDNEIQEITRGHSALFNAHRKLANTKAEKGSRKTFITFKLRDYYAVSMDEVREIVDVPEQLLHPPGLAKHFQGVLNLRGTLVAIADGRTLYAMEDKPRTGNEKILVFEDGESKYGLTVDSIESIANMNDIEQVRLPAILYKNNLNPASEDVREAVEWESGEKKRVVLMVLDLGSLAKRIAA